MACPERTVPVEANPTYIRMTSASGITAPYTPNCARLEIIWGSPSLGPWAEWRAMTAPPSTFPTNRPTMAQKASAPNTTARAPSTMAVICALAPNHSVNWPLGWPWRSPGGIISMDRASTAVLPGPRLLAEKLHVGDKFDVRQHGLRSSLPVLCTHGVGDFPV